MDNNTTLTEGAKEILTGSQKVMNARIATREGRKKREADKQEEIRLQNQWWGIRFFRKLFKL